MSSTRAIDTRRRDYLCTGIQFGVPIALGTIPTVVISRLTDAKPPVVLQVMLLLCAYGRRDALRQNIQVLLIRHRPAS